MVVWTSVRVGVRVRTRLLTLLIKAVGGLDESAKGDAPRGIAFKEQRGDEDVRREDHHL